MSEHTKEPLQIVDSLIYRLTDGVNSDEINISMWNGSRGAVDRDEGARFVFACINEADELKRQRDELLEALQGLYDDISGLMSESTGVIGLHLNGDEAPWGELEEGGLFERLSHMTAAQEAIAKATGERQ